MPVEAKDAEAETELLLPVADTPALAVVVPPEVELAVTLVDALVDVPLVEDDVLTLAALAPVTDPPALATSVADAAVDAAFVVSVPLALVDVAPDVALVDVVVELELAVVVAVDEFPVTEAPAAELVLAVLVAALAAVVVGGATADDAVANCLSKAAIWLELSGPFVAAALTAFDRV